MSGAVRKEKLVETSQTRFGVTQVMTPGEAAIIAKKGGIPPDLRQTLSSRPFLKRLDEEDPFNPMVSEFLAAYGTTGDMMERINFLAFYKPLITANLVKGNPSPSLFLGRNGLPLLFTGAMLVVTKAEKDPLLRNKANFRDVFVEFWNYRMEAASLLLT